LYRHDQFDDEKKSRYERKERQVAQEQRHLQQIELQRQKQVSEVKVEPIPHLPMSVPAPTTSRNENYTKVPILEPLVPEDSFSYGKVPLYWIFISC
jgi:hypothetical protein